MPRRRLAALIGVILAIAACAATQRAPSSIAAIDHVIVIYQENWSFDSLLGKFPGANGIANASPTSIAQTDKDGKPYATLPPSIDTRQPPPVPDARIPAVCRSRRSTSRRTCHRTHEAAIRSIAPISSSTRSTAGAWTGSSRGPTSADSS